MSGAAHTLCSDQIMKIEIMKHTYLYDWDRSFCHLQGCRSGCICYLSVGDDDTNEHVDDENHLVTEGISKLLGIYLRKQLVLRKIKDK